MDIVLEQLNHQQKKDKPKLTKLQIIYKIYHFATKVFLYSILLILILVGIIFLLYFIDMQSNLKKGISKQPLFGAYVIISPSMVPTIKVYDAIIIKRAEPEELEVGDIITFLSNDARYSGLTITHRIVGIEKSKTGEVYFRTKGDNNNTEDSSLVKGEDINGKVIFKIPKIGYIQHLLTNAVGWVLLIVVPCLGVVIYDILKIFKSLKKRKYTKRKKIPMEEKDDYIETFTVSTSPTKKTTNSKNNQGSSSPRINNTSIQVNNDNNSNDIEIL